MKVINKIKKVILDYINIYFMKLFHLSLVNAIGFRKNLKLKQNLYYLIKSKKITGGYIPYIHEQTDIHIYNFFSINYGIRSEFDVIVSFTNSELKCLHSFHKVLKPREILTISKYDLKTFTNKIKKADFCIVTLLNPRLPNYHGGWIGGQLRFWGSYGDFASFVHSIPISDILQKRIKIILDKKKIKDIGILAERRIYPSKAKEVIHYGVGKKPLIIKNRGDLSTQLKTPYGYSVIKDQEVSSIYHDAPLNRTSRHKKSNLDCVHTLAMPPYVDCDAELFFGEACSNGSEFKVTFWSRNIENNQVKKYFEKSILVKNKNSLKLSDICPLEDLKKYQYWINFQPLKGKHDDHYINQIFKSKDNKIFDCVHSHPFIYNETNLSNSGRSLKFAPYRLSFNENFYPVLALWSGTHEEVEIRLRVFSSVKKNNENIYNLRLQPKQVIYLDLREYTDKDLISNDQSNLFIAQIECDEVNLVGSLFNISFEKRIIKSIGVDHLTGG